MFVEALASGALEHATLIRRHTMNEQPFPEGMEALETLRQAYLYAYPLVLLEETKIMVTNTEYPTDTQAPLNQLFHAKELATPALISLTRPNVDTVYSQAYLDLGPEPYILYKPKTDRYCSVQLFNGYSVTPVVLGTGALGGSDEHHFAFTGPFFQGTLPEGVIQVKVSTNFLWLLIRTKTFGPDDMPGVYDVQQRLQLYPLSAHGKNYTPPKGSYLKENDFVALEKVGKMPITEFFGLFNQLAKNNPGTIEDAPALASFKPLGIGTGETFTLDALPKPLQDEAEKLSAIFTPEFSVKHAQVRLVNNWVFMGNNVGEFGTDYAFRAVVAYGGYTNPVSMAVYPSMSHDAQGNELRGEKAYRLRFEQGMLPPHEADGWWSLTVYNQAGYLIENPLKRYNINEQSNTVFGADGSLELYLQAESPGGEKERNWLPTSPGPISLTIRIYLPKPPVLDMSWKLPPLEELG